MKCSVLARDFPRFSPKLVLVSCPPPSRCPLLYNSYQSGKAKAIMCFLWNTCSQPTVSFQTSGNPFCMHDLTVAHDWLVTVIDKDGEDVSPPSRKHGQSCSLGPQGWLWHCQDLKSLSMDNKVNTFLLCPLGAPTSTFLVTLYLDVKSYWYLDPPKTMCNFLYAQSHPFTELHGKSLGHIRADLIWIWIGSFWPFCVPFFV